MGAPVEAIFLETVLLEAVPLDEADRPGLETVLPDRDRLKAMQTRSGRKTVAIQ